MRSNVGTKDVTTDRTSTIHMLRLMQTSAQTWGLKQTIGTTRWPKTSIGQRFRRFGRSGGVEKEHLQEGCLRITPETNMEGTYLQRQNCRKNICSSCIIFNDLLEKSSHKRPCEAMKHIGNDKVLDTSL